MKLKSIKFVKLEIPFKGSFKHASAERSVTQAVIAFVESVDSIVGYGEGCPREYVTGENIQSCMSFLERNYMQILYINDVPSLRSWITENSNEIDKNPAAWCAVEAAILDLLGKLNNSSVENLLKINEAVGNFSYTAVLGTSSIEVFTKQLTQYQSLGFDDFKLKVSGDSLSDKSRLESIKAGNSAAKIRLDANNLWNKEAEATDYLSALGTKIWAIEEPLKVGDLGSLKQLAKSFECKIILDESFLQIGQLEDIKDEPEIWIPNIRISKMGGLYRSFQIAKKCRDHGLKFIIGAQVGETSLLTRAALSLASNFRDLLIAQEGAFGTYLLTKDVTSEPLMFGKQGILSYDGNKLHGFGVDYNL